MEKLIIIICLLGVLSCNNDSKINKILENKIQDSIVERDIEVLKEFTKLETIHEYYYGVISKLADSAVYTKDYNQFSNIIRNRCKYVDSFVKYTKLYIDKLDEGVTLKIKYNIK